MRGNGLLVAQKNEQAQILELFDLSGGLGFTIDEDEWCSYVCDVVPLAVLDSVCKPAGRLRVQGTKLEMMTWLIHQLQIGELALHYPPPGTEARRHASSSQPTLCP